MNSSEPLVDRIALLAKESNISVAHALRESEAGKDFVANIKKGQKPSYDKVLKIANYFNVSVDYLLGNTDKKEKAESQERPDVKRLVELYAQLDDKEKSEFTAEFIKFINNKK